MLGILTRSDRIRGKRNTGHAFDLKHSDEGLTKHFPQTLPHHLSVPVIFVFQIYNIYNFYLHLVHLDSLVLGSHSRFRSLIIIYFHMKENRLLPLPWKSSRRGNEACVASGFWGVLIYYSY